jgi:hypothetical protein
MLASAAWSASGRFVGGSTMTDVKQVVLILSLGVVSVTGLHLVININWANINNSRLPPGQRKLNVAFIPVT